MVKGNRQGINYRFKKLNFTLNNTQTTTNPYKSKGEQDNVKSRKREKKKKYIKKKLTKSSTKL